jgi:hypothetical protein
MYPSRKQISYNNRTKKMRGGDNTKLGPGPAPEPAPGPAPEPAPEQEAKSEPTPAEEPNTNTNTSPENDDSIKSKFNNAAAKASAGLSSGVNGITTGISNIGNFVTDSIGAAVDTYNTIKNTQAMVIDTMTNPNFPAMVDDVSEKAYVVLDKASPAINKATEVIGEAVAHAVEKSGSKISKAVAGAASNAVGGIPGVGIPIAAARTAEKASEAAQAAVEAFGDVTKAAKDAISSAVPQSGGAERAILKNRKNTAKTMKMVGGSIAEFMDSTLNPSFFAQTGGGGSRESKRRRRFSKRRRQ